MIIRKIREEDAHEISRLTVEEFPYTSATKEKVLERKKSGAMIFTAIEKDAVIGFVDFEMKEKQAMINGLTVKKEFRGKHVGKKLAFFAVNFLALKGADKIMLLVKQENSAAKKIYQSLGFRTNGLLEKKMDNSLVEQMELKITQQGFH